MTVRIIYEKGLYKDIVMIFSGFGKINVKNRASMDNGSIIRSGRPLQTLTITRFKGILAIPQISIITLAPKPQFHSM